MSPEWHARGVNQRHCADVVVCAYCVLENVESMCVRFRWWGGFGLIHSILILGMDI